ncbi:MAG TPA: polysaccharide deacetylase family protein [Nitrososphaerales archaeon]|nr:polysaccharide deacetylase family protein [Nitrososphaerales archaeon]
MSLKRSAKRLAVKSVSSQVGSSALVSREVLRALRLEYGPFDHKLPAAAPKAVSCISVDFDVTNPTRFHDNRKGTLALLELADRYRMPITWAICGRSAEDDMTSYSAILDASTTHELAVHTYSHIDATRCGAQEFRDDIVRCIQSLGLDSPRSFVFPWNREAHFEVLRDLGFRAFRGKHRAIGTPVKEEGLWNIRPVYYVDQKSRGAGSLIGSYIDLCVNRSAVFHLWTHPWSIATGGRTEPMQKTLEQVFEHLARRREEGVLATLTLGRIASILDLEEVPPAAPREAVNQAAQRAAS